MSINTKYKILRAVYRYFWVSACVVSLHPLDLEAQTQTGDGSSFELLPHSYSAGLGYGLSPRPLFGQESVYREAFQFNGTLHWNCVLLEDCSILLRTGVFTFLDLPSSETAIEMEQVENRLSIGLGFETTALVPFGLSVGAARVSRTYRYQLGAPVTNEAGQSQWTESAVKPLMDLWLGVPLSPDRVNLNFTLSRFFAVQSPEDYSVYGVELRLTY